MAKRSVDPTLYPYWNNLVKKHNAIKVKSLAGGKDHPDSAIWFETRNFGWILSKVNAEGKRRILEQF